MPARISIFSRLLAITVISVVALAAVGVIGVVSTKAVKNMLSRTETEALYPIEQIAKLNELMQESFRELLLALQHNPDLAASKFHNHGMKVHVDALEKSLQEMSQIFQNYRKSPAGTLFIEATNRAEAAEIKLAEILRRHGEMMLSGEAEAYRQVGIDVTVNILPLFAEAKVLALELLEDHRLLSKDIALAAEAQYVFSRFAIIASCIVIFAIVLGSTIWMSRSITVPLHALSGAMNRLADGSPTNVIPCLERKDEIGQMAAALKVFKDNMAETEQLRIDKSNFETSSIQQRKADMIELADSFEAAVGGIVGALSSASSELESSAGTLMITANKSERIAGAVATAVSSAVANVKSTAAASETMSASIVQISARALESTSISSKAVIQAEQTNSRIALLAESASRIGDVIALINSVAAQTNLLALNATIEAARAGDAGRGFAVVASEVKALAEQTAKATGEISQQISTMQAATGDAVDSIKDISATIGKMSEIAAVIAAAVEVQDSATREIALNAEQATQSTLVVSSNIEELMLRVGGTGESSVAVQESAQSLWMDSNRLQEQVSIFLTRVRSN